MTLSASILSSETLHIISLSKSDLVSCDSIESYASEMAASSESRLNKELSRLISSSGFASTKCELSS